MKKQVYLDNASATQTDKRVLSAMSPYFFDRCGNPSSFHEIGKQAKDDVEDARGKVANILNAHSDEIIFTSGGTESDNLAVLGFARRNCAMGKHIITTAIEHHAVLEAVKHLEEKEGFEVTYLSPSRDGLVSANQVEDALRPDTILVSVMHANNETGTIQPIAEIGRVVKQRREAGGKQTPVFHVDACQSAAYLDLNVEKLHVDLLTLNGSKIYGPKGIGVLYTKRGLKLEPLQFGGSQERALRPGTENVPGIIGLACALELVARDREKETVRLTKLRDLLIGGIQTKISKTRLNGHATLRLPNNVNISFMDIEGESLVLYLDAHGIYVSTGSACASASLDPSHVILALGLPPEVAHGSVRFSLGRDTTKKDIDYVLKTLPALVEKLRGLSPVKVDEKYFV